MKAYQVIYPRPFKLRRTRKKSKIAMKQAILA
jgi:hypothetical protein